MNQIYKSLPEAIYTPSTLMIENLTNSDSVHQKTFPENIVVFVVFLFCFTHYGAL